MLRKIATCSKTCHDQILVNISSYDGEIEAVQKRN